MCLKKNLANSCFFDDLIYMVCKLRIVYFWVYITWSHCIYISKIKYLVDRCVLSDCKRKLCWLSKCLNDREENSTWREIKWVKKYKGKAGVDNTEEWGYFTNTSLLYTHWLLGNSFLLALRKTPLQATFLKVH